MAVINIAGIKNANDKKVENRKSKVAEMQALIQEKYYKICVDYGQQIEDAIDTFKYARENGLRSEMKKFLRTDKAFELFFDNGIALHEHRASDYQKTWDISTDGHNFYIREGYDNWKNLDELLKSMYYDDDNHYAKFVYERIGGKDFKVSDLLTALDNLIGHLDEFLNKFFDYINTL